ncbi:hypothetical protein ACN47E_002275 [Coniothyrium glycines]
MARRMTAEEYQELGRRYYKLKQYDKALELLSQGIAESPTVALYDHRAAAYDKLGDFNNAVKDGREMIKLDKSEVKGYLRTASVLEKMDNLDTALKIYKYGMKNVPVTDKNYKLLQQVHDRLTRKLSPATAVDPFTALPTELVELILSDLSFANMVNCMRVSRGWRDYLSRLPKLWMHLDLSGARKPVPRSFVNKAVKRSEDRVARLTIHRFEHMDMLTNIARLCRNLTEVDFVRLPHTLSATLLDMVQAASNLKKFVMRPEMTLDTATAILRYRPELHHVCFRALKGSQYTADWRGPFPHLKHIEFGTVMQAPAGHLNLQRLFQQTQALESINLTNVSGFGFDRDLEGLAKLKCLTLNLASSLIFSHFPPSLEQLDINCRDSFHLRNFASSLAGIALPRLTHFALHSCDDIHAAALVDLLDMAADEHGAAHPLPAAAPLESLALGGALQSRYSCVDLLAQLRSTSRRMLTHALRHLDLATLPCDDDAVEVLLAGQLALESINLSHTNITGAAIKMLADALPSLRVIRADQCPRINGRDAIHYAERKGIHVSCQMGVSKGGRKVRYG